MSEDLTASPPLVPGFGAAASYALLPAQFYAHVAPAAVARPQLVKFNSLLAQELGLGLDEQDPDSLAAIFSGNRLLPGAHPLAMVYAGHQFGQFVPRLGDGRALLLGELRDRFGRWREVQLKGAGRTPYSRGGDGRAALGPVLREYLVSEAMHALHIPATRALAAVTTGEAVLRERPLPGAILTRVAASHVRVGTFQYFAARGDLDSTRRLADYVIERQFPEASAVGDPYLELLRRVVARQASLVAAWMNVGFIHGVMNTDNMAVSGETIDFGPCAFMDAYDPSTVFSSIDRLGRYAYQNQPAAAQWNLARFAETLLPLIDAQSERAIELATAAVGEFSREFDAQWLAGMRRKLGLLTAEEGDLALARGLLEAMHAGAADFTLTFRRLCMAAQDVGADAEVERLFTEPAAYRQWAEVWRTRRARDAVSGIEQAAMMRSVNPAVIARNHRIEQAIAAAIEQADYGPFEALAAALSRPYEELASSADYASPPLPEERVLQTFCGT